MDKYKVILADPPWPSTPTGPRGNAATHYSLMTMEQICALPVKDWAEDNAALFLWIKSPAIPESIPVMAAWGFTFKTVAFVWVKTCSSLGIRMGIGSYTRPQTEMCLLGIRGRMPVAAHDVRQVITAPRREHSRKPDEVYQRIERLYPDGPHLELFARQPWPGWTAWGNQTNRFDTTNVLPGINNSDDSYRWNEGSTTGSGSAPNQAE